jgi:metallo-beta-lactamase family protein
MRIRPDCSTGTGTWRNAPPVCLVHGEDQAREALAAKLRAQFGTDVALAHPGMVRKV